MATWLLQGSMAADGAPMATFTSPQIHEYVPFHGNANWFNSSLRGRRNLNFQFARDVRECSTVVSKRALAPAKSSASLSVRVSRSMELALD